MAGESVRGSVPPRLGSAVPVAAGRALCPPGGRCQLLSPLPGPCPHPGARCGGWSAVTSPVPLPQAGHGRWNVVAARGMSPKSCSAGQGGFGPVTVTAQGRAQATPESPGGGTGGTRGWGSPRAAVPLIGAADGGASRSGAGRRHQLRHRPRRPFNQTAGARGRGQVAPWHRGCATPCHPLCTPSVLPVLPPQNPPAALKCGILIPRDGKGGMPWDG